MRSLILAAALVMTSATLAPAQTIPNLTFPEPGTFCGFVKPCDVETSKTQISK